MKIKKIELSNVKCYSNAEFDFEKGINFISGVNGAGKTSIIESIGFALFGYKVGIKNFTNYFIRRGEKKASVRIIFEDKSEDEYIVERKISTSSNNSWVIKDIDNEEEIVSGDTDVINWLKDHLGFYRGDNMEQIYENIISVPQGMFTSVFMDKPVNRKNKFDPIFNLEIYRRVFTNTANLDSSLKEKKSDAEKEAGKLEEGIKYLTKSKTEYTELKEKLTAIKNKKEEKDKKYNELDKIYQEKNNIKDEIAKINETIKIDNVKNENLNKNVESLKKDLEIANNAKKVLEDNKQGYENYMQEEKKQKQLRTRKNQYDSLISHKKELEANVESCSKIINVKEENKKEKQENIKNIDKELTEIDVKIQEEEKNLNSKLIILEQQKMEIEEVREKENILDKEKTSIEKNNLIIQNNISNVKKLEKKVETQKDLLNQKQKLENKIEEKEKIEKEKLKIEEDLSKLSARLEYIKESKEIAKDGICPYLKSQCKNVQGKTQEEYDAEIEEIVTKTKNSQKEREEVVKQEKEVIKAEAELKSVIIKLQEIQETEKEIQNINKDIKEKEENIKKSEEKIQKILKSNSIEEIEDITEAIKEFKKISQQKQKVFNDEDKEYDILKTNLNNRKKEKEKQHNSLTKSKEQLSKLEKEIQIEKDKIEKYNLQIIQTEKELEEYSTIDKEIKENEIKLQEAKPAYDIYMQNIEMAKNSSKIEKELKKCLEDIEIISKKLKDSKVRFEELNKEYNEEEFKSLEKERNSLMLEVTEINAQIKNTKERIDLLKKEVDELKQTKQILKEQNKKIEVYRKVIEYVGKIRRIIKQVPEDISELLIQKVSRKATEIYTKIANDNTRLEWREGYEVILVDNIDGKTIEKEFRQLSGGEQMSAALAIRISMLEILTNLKLGILDEPTVNMDIGRRQRLAEIIEGIGGLFVQLFIVSHDDTFNSITENTIQLG